VFVIVGVAIAFGLIAFLLVARSRSRMPAPVQALSGQSVYMTPVRPAAAPGWQSVDGDPARIAYWDGARFTAWKRWDGANWVD
jgi:hypothetical protein